MPTSSVPRIERDWPLRLRAFALALAPSLLVVLALLWTRSARLYFEALATPGPVVAATPALFAVASAAAALAACTMWRSRAGGADCRLRGAWFATIALLGAAAAVYAAFAGPVPHQRVAHLLHGMAPREPHLTLAVVLALLALSPVLARLPGLPRGITLPPVLVPGAAVGALAALNQPGGCEAVVAQVLLAATLVSWMVLEIVEDRAWPSAAPPASRATSRSGPASVVWSAIQRRAFTIGVLACCAIAVWITWPAWRHGIITNQDAPRHLLRAKVMAEIFLPAGHVDGWSPYWYLGAQLFLFQSYGYFFVIGAVANLLDGLVRLQNVFKFFYALPIVALPAAVAWLACSLGANRRAAFAAAFASLALGSAVGYGVKGVYGTGLLLQGVGIVLFAIVLPLVLDALEGKPRAAWIAALLLGVIFVTHFITAAYVMTAAGSVALGMALWKREAAPLVRYTLLALAALLLSGHALFPSLELRSLAGSAVGWGNMEDRFVRFLFGKGVGPPWLVVPALVAAAIAIARRRGRLAIAALLLFGTAFLASSSSSTFEPRVVSDMLRVVVRPRAVPYAVLLTAVFVGVAFDALLSFLAASGSSSRAPASAGPTAAWPWRQAAIVVACVAFFSVGALDIALVRSQVTTEATLRPKDHSDYAQLARWLRANVPRPAIVEIDRTGLPSRMTGAQSVISILNLDTGLFTLGGDQAELTSAGSRTRALRGEKLAAQAATSARQLRVFGVSYVIATDAASRRRLDLSEEYQRVYEALHVAVYRVRNSGSWLTGAGIRASSFDFAPEHLRWQVVVAGARSRPATVAVSWHPNWRALVDGVPVAIERTSRQLVSFNIASGSHVVDLQYVRRWSEHVYDLISASALLVIAGGLAISIRNSRRGG